MRVEVYRVRTAAILPSYGTAGAAGMDICACLDAPLRIKPGDIGRIPTGIAVAVPEGYEGQVRPRSGWTLKGFDVKLGTIDSDYRGELWVIYHAYRGVKEIKHGDRIAQVVFAAVVAVRLAVVAGLGETARGAGGFGSTGVSPAGRV